MMEIASIPPLFANALRYSPGDHVRTPFGAGIVRSLSDNNPHVEVELAFGATLFATRTSLVPELRMLACGEIPKHTAVLFAPPAKFNNSDNNNNTAAPAVVVERTLYGTIESFHIREQQYDVLVTSATAATDKPTTMYRLRSDALRFAPSTRVQTPVGRGSVTSYRDASDSYTVALDNRAIGYFVHSAVSCLDLRLLERVPLPLSADAIYQQLDGRITRDDACALSARAHVAYQRVQQLCETHVDALSMLSTSASYSSAYASALTSLVDPSVAIATKRVQRAGALELTKLHALATSTKRAFETELLAGRDTTAFVAQAARVLSQLKDSSEVQRLEQRIRMRASEEFAAVTTRKRTNTDAIAAVDVPPTDRLVLSNVLDALEVKVRAQQQPATQLTLELLTKLQQHEADVARCTLETAAHVEQLAAAHFGVASLAALTPHELLARAEALLPRLTTHAGDWLASSERYLSQLQSSTHGQTLVQKAKALAASVDSDPDAFCANVTSAISDVQLNKLAKWTATLRSSQDERQALVNHIKDQCLDFLLSVLPTIQVDTITGVAAADESIEYALSKLDLSHFHVRKDRVKVRMGTVSDEALLTVRATHLTALLEGFDWTFTQRTFPYLNGKGVADAHLSGGVIAFGFKAEKVLINEGPDGKEYRPTLVLHSMEIEIQHELTISVHGSWFSAVYNLLASVFAASIRDYLAKTMESKLLGHMMSLLATLNHQMDEYWPLVFHLLDIRVEDLPSASLWRGAKALDAVVDDAIELESTFHDRTKVPFAFTKSALHRCIVVSRVMDPDNTSAELLRVPIGAPVLAINGFACQKLTLEEFNRLLQETLAVPFTLRFALSPDAVAATSYTRQRVVPRVEHVAVVFKQPGPFGFRLRSRPLAPFGSIVVGFTTTESNSKSAAERSGKICAGQLLLRVNDVDVRFKSLAETLALLKETTRRPATLHFAPSPDGVVTLREWPPMIELEAADVEGDDDDLEEDESKAGADGRLYCVLSAFVRVPSFAQKSRVVAKRDVLVRVNDTSLLAPTQTSFAGIMATLKRLADSGDPMRAVFVTQDEYIAMREWLNEQAAATAVTSGASEEESASDIADTTPPSDLEAVFLATIAPRELVFPKPPLGILFGNLNEEAVYVRQFISSSGAAEKSGLLQLGQAVLQVCGKTVPMDATPAVIEQMIVDVAHREPRVTSFSITVRDLDMERELMK